MGIFAAETSSGSNDACRLQYRRPSSRGLVCSRSGNTQRPAASTDMVIVGRDAARAGDSGAVRAALLGRISVKGLLYVARRCQ